MAAGNRKNDKGDKMPRARSHAHGDSPPSAKLSVSEGDYEEAEDDDEDGMEYVRESGPPVDLFV
eukprot:jgi/Hompol1/263/HPOL_005268-RA